MAKILVADDNSNIQKMVGVALKDQGIDVVAVGNGEAAVRKISDVKPDLVLADVFMPVRNGYEVCKYVKDDTALAHIPVILLVGAFDPLDEQEAQRVGADGVLKKPFVPPDPLISMVKSALTRAGVSYSGDSPKNENGAAQAVEPAAPPPPKPAVPLAAAPLEEPFHEPVSKRQNPLTIEPSSQPLAFGSLLETPQAEEDEAAYVTRSTSDLMPERSWGGEEPEEDEVAEEEEDSAASSWRRGGGADFGDAPAGGKGDWRDALAESEAAKKSSYSAPWVPTKEKSDFSAPPEPVPSLPTIAELSAQPQPSAGPSWGSVIQATENNPPAPVHDKFADTDFPSEIPAPSSYAGETVFAESAAVLEAPAALPPAPEPVTEKTPEPAAAAPPASSGTSWYSVASSPWEAEAQKAGKLAATWDTDLGKSVSPSPAPAEEIKEESVAAMAIPEIAPAPENEPEPEIPAVNAYSGAETQLTPSAHEAIREETEQAVEQAIQEAAPAASSSAVAAVEPNLDDVVAKVLAKMSPEVLQAVTREILKPVVEAIVRDEINKK